jgi:hypothetical protein
MATMLEAALRYAALGLHVFPLRPATKRPYEGTHGHHDATVEVPIIRTWWTAEPDANLGIACRPSGVVVVDIDRRNGGDEADLGPTPETWRATTGDGTHLYFASGGTELPDGALLPGIDLKASGYTVAAPSRHPNGKTYRWEIGFAPGDLALAKLPEWVSRHRRTAAADSRLSRDGTPLRILAGQRNRELFRLGCALRRYGVGEAALRACLEAINREHCESPLPSAEVAAIAASATRYAAGIVPAISVPPAHKNILEVRVR